MISSAVLEVKLQKVIAQLNESEPSSFYHKTKEVLVRKARKAATLRKPFLRSENEGSFLMETHRMFVITASQMQIYGAL